MSDNPMYDAEKLRRNMVYNSVAAKLKDGKAGELATVAIDKNPKDILQDIDKLLKSVEKIEVGPDGERNRLIIEKDPENAVKQRNQLWYSAQTAISKLNASDKVKGELFREFIDAQAKVYEGLGGIGGVVNSRSLIDGVEDLKSFRESLKKAEKSYGAMTEESHNAWQKKEIMSADEFKKHEDKQFKNNAQAKPELGAIAPTQVAFATQEGKGKSM